MKNDIDDLMNEVDRIADTSFDASDIAPKTKTFGTNTIAERRSGSAVKAFYRPGERPDDGAPFTPTTTIPKYSGPPSGRVPTDDEKRGSWQLQEEYLAGRLGKNEEENGRFWNTATWMDKLLRIATKPAEALPPLNIYVGDKNIAKHGRNRSTYRAG